MNSTDSMRKTSGRLAGLRALRDGKTNMPGSPSMNTPLEKAGVICWSRIANAYSLTVSGVEMLRRWEGEEPGTERLDNGI